MQDYTRNNVVMILDVLLDDILGYLREQKHPQKNNSPVYLALYSHAVKEYGKLLYLKGLIPDESDMMTIHYDKDGKNKIPNTFKDHTKKLTGNKRITGNTDSFSYYRRS